jgi:hypothetical protein
MEQLPPTPPGAVDQNIFLSHEALQKGCQWQFLEYRHVSGVNAGQDGFRIQLDGSSILGRESKVAPSQATRKLDAWLHSKSWARKGKRKSGEVMQLDEVPRLDSRHR